MDIYIYKRDNMSKEIKYELNNLTREKMSQKKMGALNPNFGKPRSVVTKEKIAQSQRAAWNKRKATGERKDRDNEEWTSFQLENKIIALMKGIGKHKTIILNEEGFNEFLLYLQEKIDTKTGNNPCQTE